MTDNPFLLPPGRLPPAPLLPGPTPVPAPALIPPSDAPARDPDRFIAIPPSIESATHRIVRPETSQPATPEPLASAPPSDPVPTRWSLVLPDGVRVAVDRPIVLGRHPAVPADSPDAMPVALVDASKTVSKTHALLRPATPGWERQEGIRITDLHSTNGVALTVGGVRTVLVPGGEGIAVVGAVIELGSFTVLLDRR